MLKNAVFRGILTVVIISLMICSILLIYFISGNLLKKTEYDMSLILPIIDYSLNYDSDLKKQVDEINPLIIDDTTRITIVRTDGTIVADTSDKADYNENHLNREEIQSALKDNIGIKIRYSETMHTNLLYAAYLSQNGQYIIRLAIPYMGIMSYVEIIAGAVAIGIIGSFIIAFFIAKSLSKSITEPLNEISEELSKIHNEDKKPNFSQYKYDEINYIAKAAQVLSQRIDRNVEKLKYEKNKIDYIIDNMAEGLVLLDENSDVIIINRKALEVLGAGKAAVSKNIMTYTQNINVINCIEAAFKGNRESYIDIEKNKRIYSLHITKTQKGILNKEMYGIIILIVDVTSERENQRIRQDFFSVASHELKTPITSIQGYAELLGSDMGYTEERKKQFIGRIQSEAENMTNLINDILMISRLEAGTEAEEKTRVWVNNIIVEVLEINQPMTNKNNIEVKNLTVDNVIIQADYKKVYQMIDNLISNAVRYNKENGKIFIKAELKNGQFVFSIKDTGIGIPFDAQKRVFERFYRVDKGRSRKIGGTGLGLSIVKHVVSFYKGNINLKSTPGKGTEINVSWNIR